MGITADVNDIKLAHMLGHEPTTLARVFWTDSGERIHAVTKDASPTVTRSDNNYIRPIFERLRKLNAEVVKLYDCHSQLPESLKIQFI